MTCLFSGAEATSTSLRALGPFFAGTPSDASGVMAPMVHITDTGEAGEPFGEGGAMPGIMGDSLGDEVSL